MLLELKVNHFAIIDNLHLQFGPGLNILSGETGAGKSVLLKGLGLLMGMKGSSEQIRSGAASASIEGRFDLSKRVDVAGRLTELGIDCDDMQLVVRRVISEDKSRVYLNGSLSTLNQLREVIAPLLEVAGNAAPLIEMTGQHDSRHLLSKAYHLDIIDMYGGLWETRSQYHTLFREMKDAQARVLELRANLGVNERELDYLKFQREEIVAFDPSPGEDVELENEIKRIKSIHRLTGFVDQARAALGSEEHSVVTTLQRLLNRAQELSSLDESLAENTEGLRIAKDHIEDVLFKLERNYSLSEDGDSLLERLEDRMSQLRKIQKKYGPTVDDILAHLLKIETEIGSLANVEGEIETLEKKITRMRAELERRADDLHTRRVNAVKLFVGSVNDELLDLNMKGLRFSVHVERARDEDGRAQLLAYGVTDLEFCTQTSAKDTPRPLAKYASGGELSRILLSIKRVGGIGRFPRTYLFDEVDTGVSGETAEKVGRKLRSISNGQQVICVTHLPQVAVFADSHFYIHKNPAGGSVAMEVTTLKPKDRVQEIARLVSGERITPASLKHAEELLKHAGG